MLDRLLGYLWDSKEIQDTFVQDYFIKNCNEHFKKQEKQQALDMIEMVVHDLFLEHTS